MQKKEKGQIWGGGGGKKGSAKKESVREPLKHDGLHRGMGTRVAKEKRREKEPTVGTDGNERGE